MKNNLDEYAMKVVTDNPNMLVPWWIMSAWAYEQGDPIVSDGVFDKIASLLTKNWSAVNHVHKSLLRKKDLHTSLAIGGKWPQISIAAAQALQLNCKGRRRTQQIMMELQNESNWIAGSSSQSTGRKPEQCSKIDGSPSTGRKKVLQAGEGQASREKVSHKLEKKDDTTRSAPDRKSRGQASAKELPQSPDRKSSASKKDPTAGSVNKRKMRWAKQRMANS